MEGIILDPNSSHPVLDVSYWRSMFRNRLEGLSSDVDDPSQLFSILDVREKAKLEQKFAARKRIIDIFFWSQTQAQVAWLTRYGGAPFRSRGKPWPTRNGKIATFLGQLCFRDSKDLFSRELPGDLLLIFSFERGMYEADPDDADNPVWAEWVKIGEVADPYSANDDVPKSFFVPRLSGVRCRTYDYLFQSEDQNELEAILTKFDPRWCALASLPATKIGETYLEVQTGWDPRKWIRKHRSDSQCIGCFYSVFRILENYLKEFDFQKEKSTSFIMGDPGHLVLFDTQPTQAVAYYIAGERSIVLSD